MSLVPSLVDTFVHPRPGPRRPHHTICMIRGDVALRGCRVAAAARPAPRRTSTPMRAYGHLPGRAIGADSDGVRSERRETSRKAAASEPQIRVRDLAGRHGPRNRGNRNEMSRARIVGLPPTVHPVTGAASSSGHARVLDGHGTVIVRCGPVTVGIQRGVQPPHTVSRRRCLVAASPLSARGFHAMRVMRGIRFVAWMG